MIVTQLAEAGVGESSGEWPVVGHPGHVQVLDDDGVEPTGELLANWWWAFLRIAVTDPCSRARRRSSFVRFFDPRSQRADPTVEALQPGESGGERSRVWHVAAVVGDTVDGS